MWVSPFWRSKTAVTSSSVRRMPRSFAERYKADKRRKKRRSGCHVALVALVLCWLAFAFVAIKFVINPLLSSPPPRPPPSVAEPNPVKEFRLPPPPAPALRGSDEYELDPRTGLRVPKFWTPPATSHVEEDKIDGQPTIWLMVASYRDFQCPETLTSALSRAEHPSRVKISVVQQNAPEDSGCGCSDKFPLLCDANIWVYEMDAQKATGPVYARHVGNRMYRGEAYAMQVDAHVQFVRGWDTSLIEQFKATRNDMAVLSTYLTDLQGSIDEFGNSRRKTRPIMCNSDFEGRPPARYLRHNAQPEEEPAIRGEPMMQPFWAAGFSFSRGHFVHRVPYDCCLPMVFMGEEISIGIRAWTHGYDMYTPEFSVVFHEYAQNSKRRHNLHFFWENRNRAAGDGQKSLKRLTGLIGMAPNIADDYDKTEAEKYGLGDVRPVSEFYRLFLVDVVDKKATNLCKFVKSGIMHRSFSKFLRDDGTGVDYARLADYDTASAIRSELDVNWRPRAVQAINRALKENKVGWLRNAIDVANRAELKAVDPDLVSKADSALKLLLDAQNAP